jgi:hypothetical protein
MLRVEAWCKDFQQPPQWPAVGSKGEALISKKADR